MGVGFTATPLTMRLGVGLAPGGPTGGSDQADHLHLSTLPAARGEARLETIGQLPARGLSREQPACEPIVTGPAAALLNLLLIACWRAIPTPLDLGVDVHAADVGGPDHDLTVIPGGMGTSPAMRRLIRATTSLRTVQARRGDTGTMAAQRRSRLL
jgi:hypothetical protein